MIKNKLLNSLMLITIQIYKNNRIDLYMKKQFIPKNLIIKCKNMMINEKKN